MPCTAGLLLGWGASGCLIPNPNHCANLEGDATCIERGEGRYCTLCTRDNGCVDEKPTAECTPDTPPVSESSTTAATATTNPDATTTASSDDTGSDGPSVDCDAEGMQDETCPTDTPYCSEGTCVACDAAGGDDFCDALDASAPVCNAPRATCEPCIDGVAGSCASDEVCSQDFSCIGCRLSSDCDPGGCNPSAQSCVGGNVLWVDSSASNCPTDGSGTESDPFCSPGAAIADIAMASSGVIMLVGGGEDYATELVITGGRTIAIVGVDNPSISPGGAAISVSTNSTVVLSNLRIRDAMTGVSCQASTVALDDVAIVGNETGLMGTDCEIWVQRSTVAGSDDAGIVADGGRLNLYASMVVGNSADGVDAPNAELNMGFATIAGNGGDALNCDGGAVRSSIIVSAIEKGSLSCPGLVVSDSALSRISDTLETTNTIELPDYDEAWFDDVGILDYHLADPSGPFADVGLWRQGDPFEDIDGDAVPLSLGTRVFPGADQP